MKSHNILLIISMMSNLIIGIAAQHQTKKEINQNAIVFPTTDTNKNHTSTHNRKPVVDANRCNSEYELLYPGDNEADWVCDCKPGYLYVPQTQQCYPAYTKGPCQDGFILQSVPNSYIPQCKANNCKRNGYVSFNNNCYPLNSEEGCLDYKKIIGRKVLLQVDPTTLTLTCRDEDDKFKCENFCCKGGARDSVGKCDVQRSYTTA